MGTYARHRESVIVMADFCGKYRAIVQDNKDPENRGRIRVSCPSVFGSSLSGWCEPCFPVGDFYVPDVGKPVWVEFQQNDLKKPVWVGTWLEIDGGSTRIIKYGGATITLTSGMVLINGVDVLNSISSLEERVKSLERRLTG